MSLKEKVAYLKGLSDGVAFEPTSNEGKMFASIIDVLMEMSEKVEELCQDALDISEELDALSDDLAELEDFVYDGGDFDDDDFDYFGFDDDDEDDDDDDDDDDDGDDDGNDGAGACGDSCSCAYCGDDDFSLEIECPRCGLEIEVKEADLLHNSVTCASCGEVLEIEYDEDQEDDVEDTDL